jgi:hypothetical protein
MLALSVDGVRPSTANCHYLMLAAHKKRMQRADQLENILKDSWVHDRGRLDLIFKRGKVGAIALRLLLAIREHGFLSAEESRRQY